MNFLKNWQIWSLFQSIFLYLQGQSWCFGMCVVKWWICLSVIWKVPGLNHTSPHTQKEQEKTNPKQNKQPTNQSSDWKSVYLWMGTYLWLFFELEKVKAKLKQGRGHALKAVGPLTSTALMAMTTYALHISSNINSTTLWFAQQL